MEEEKGPALESTVRSPSPRPPMALSSCRGAARFSREEMLDTLCLMTQCAIDRNDDSAPHARRLQSFFEDVSQLTPHERMLASFDSLSPPPLTAGSYFARFCVHSFITVNAALAGLELLGRLCQKQGVCITSRNAHRLLLSAIVVAAKVEDDMQMRNSFFSVIGGLPASELFEMEKNLLRLLDFDVLVRPERLQWCHGKLAAACCRPRETEPWFSLHPSDTTPAEAAAVAVAAAAASAFLASGDADADRPMSVADTSSHANSYQTSLGYADDDTVMDRGCSPAMPGGFRTPSRTRFDCVVEGLVRFDFGEADPKRKYSGDNDVPARRRRLGSV
eukprot:TRINITY_DN14694_c0_g1_i1.p1 TRINITY_DN14694_c0_g1~~TRINITY_DN14694_c0_g1_i1.p1  ORF type:complete len:333 (+),score=100.06 TRINITY_DN14694_c0_g1_i1:261-1259(+)